MRGIYDGLALHILYALDSFFFYCTKLKFCIVGENI